LVAVETKASSEASDETNEKPSFPAALERAASPGVVVENYLEASPRIVLVAFATGRVFLWQGWNVHARIAAL